jgi:hypothetical protein
MRAGAVGVLGVLAATLCVASCGHGLCEPQRADVQRTAFSCCPGHGPVVWNGRTCVQARECGCYSCTGADCGDTYATLEACAAAHAGKCR